MMADRLISEQAVMESLTKEYNQKRTGDGLKLAWIEKAVSATPTASDWDRYSTKLWKEAYERGKRDAQPEVAKDINVPSTDCVSRQQAIDAIAEHLGIPAANWKNIANEWLKDLPTAQPEMVKCKKCRYVYYDEEFDNYWCNRMSGSFKVEADGYCKWGK